MTPLAVALLLWTAFIVGIAAPPVLAAPGEDDTPAPNPDMPQACGLDALIILDESGSVGNFKVNVQDAFKAFTSALNNTGSRIAVAEFSSVARLPLAAPATRAYTSVTSASINGIFNPYINANYNPGGSTNWEDSLRVGRYLLPRPSSTRPHLTVFITDGDPNAIVENPPPNGSVTYDPGNPNVAQNEYELKVPLVEDDETDDAGNTTAKDRAVSNANALKGQGSHVLAIAVGSGLTSPASLQRLIDVSGPDVLTSGQAFTPQTDVYRVPNFDELEDGLRALAFALCAPVVNVQKLIDVTPDPGTDDLLPAGGWAMTGVVTPTPVSWAQPPGASGSTAVGTTGGDGFIAFDWRPSGSGNQTIIVTEEDPAGVPPPPGFVNDTTATRCTFRTPANPTDRPLTITVGVGTFTAVVPKDAITTCTMVNRVPPAPDVDIEKWTNGADADDPPGPFVPVSDPATEVVTWTYTVTNTGNVTLSTIAITDTVGTTTTPVVCLGAPAPATLAPGASFTCEVEGTPEVGQYANTGTVTATDPFGTGVTDSDDSHYLGIVSGIDIEKATNGEDADLPPGPLVAIGDPVTWTYVVTNTGSGALTGIAVTDSQGVVVTCPSTTLAAGASMPCTAPAATAVSGQYENVGSVTGTDAIGTVVSDSDASHYYGEQPSIALEKYTGQDPADTPTGPLFGIGETVTWIYEFTNTGNVPVTWGVTDNQAGVVLACPRLGILAPAQSVFCHASAPAEVGQHTNIATATATSLGGTVVPPVTDPANYFGVQGGIDIEKTTNGVDADLPPGPYVLAGGAVNWEYTVTNIGNSALTGIVVTDLKGVPVTCPADTLAAGASMPCTGSGVAEEDQYTNHAIVVGTTPIGTEVSDSDPSHYFGGVPGIDLQKFTNGLDSDEPTGVFIPEGDPVTWTYEVTNSGNTALTGLAVTDDQGLTVTCPQTDLAVGEKVVCTAPEGVAELGQYANVATATGTSAGVPLTATDPSHYFGFVSQIDVEKFVNGEDADTAPGLELDAGDPITWTYEVTNPGNILIRNVVLVDDQGLVPVFTGGDAGVIGELEPGEVWIYEASSTAVAGLHTNIATVSGLDLLEQPVEDSDPANYTAAGPLPAIIGDLVWEDPNSNQAQDAGEAGIAGARVTITNTATGADVTATTDADGHYRATVAAGEYTVVLDMASVGSTLTTPGTYTVTVAEGDEFLDADFGVIEDPAGGELPDEDEGELPNTAMAAPSLAQGGLLLLIAAAVAAQARRRQVARAG